MKAVWVTWRCGLHVSRDQKKKKKIYIYIYIYICVVRVSPIPPHPKKMNNQSFPGSN